MKPSRHPPVMCALHWAIAAMIIAALVLSTFVMSRIPDTAPTKIPALIRHMSVGALIFIASALRLYLRRKTVRPDPLPSGMPWADLLAVIVHRSLEVMIFVMIGTGVTMAILAGLPSAIWNGTSLAVSLDGWTLRTIHICTATLIASALLLHVCGAFYHQVLLRDGLMSRMWFGPSDKQPPTKERTGFDVNRPGFGGGSNS